MASPLSRLEHVLAAGHALSRLEQLSIGMEAARVREQNQAIADLENQIVQQNGLLRMLNVPPGTTAVPANDPLRKQKNRAINDLINLETKLIQAEKKLVQVRAPFIKTAQTHKLAYVLSVHDCKTRTVDFLHVLERCEPYILSDPNDEDPDHLSSTRRALLELYETERRFYDTLSLHVGASPEYAGGLQKDALSQCTKLDRVVKKADDALKEIAEKYKNAGSGGWQAIRAFEHAVMHAEHFMATDVRTAVNRLVLTRLVNKEKTPLGFYGVKFGTSVLASALDDVVSSLQTLSQPFKTTNAVLQQHAPAGMRFAWFPGASDGSRKMRDAAVAAGESAWACVANMNSATTFTEEHPDVPKHLHDKLKTLTGEFRALAGDTLQQFSALSERFELPIDVLQNTTDARVGDKQTVRELYARAQIESVPPSLAALTKINSKMFIFKMAVASSIPEVRGYKFPDVLRDM